MKYPISLVVELVAATLARLQGSGSGLAVVVNEAHRILPILEFAGPTAYVNLRQVLHQDFRVVPGGLPAAKERVSAVSRPAEAADLVARAQVLLICVPDDAGAAAVMPDFDPAGRFCIVYGATRAAGWSKITQRLRGDAFSPVEVAGARMLISREAIDAIGGRHMLMPNALGELAGRLAKTMPALLAAEAHGGGIRLRIKPDPIQLIVSGTDCLSHNLSKEARALFNARGIGSLSLPTEGRGTLQLLVRNVRDRIDSLTISVGTRAVPLTRIDYTEYGAVLSIPPTVIDAGMDALMYLALPRSAVPHDGFCDIGAITQTLELA